eukprot:1195635-Prorocentrum_minimum.AAC.2
MKPPCYWRIQFSRPFFTDTDSCGTREHYANVAAALGRLRCARTAPATCSSATCFPRRCRRSSRRTTAATAARRRVPPRPPPPLLTRASLARRALKKRLCETLGESAPRVVCESIA